MTAETSKAFRARIDGLREHETMNLQRWAQKNLALSALFISDRGSIVLVALTDKPRDSKSFSRTIRQAFRRMAIPTISLKGKWAITISEQEAVVLCTGGSDLRAPPSSAPATGQGYDDNAKTITLRGPV